MKPKNSPQADAPPLQLFQSRLDSQINPDHPLCQLAERIDWDRFDDSYAPLYCEDKGAAVIRLAGSSNRGLSVSERKRKRRRSAIESVIGHLKSDHRLDRCFLRGRIGDATNLLGSALGFNVLKLLRLLGRGIFSHALLAFDRFLPTVWRSVTETMKNWVTTRRPRIRPENWEPHPLAEIRFF